MAIRAPQVVSLTVPRGNSNETINEDFTFNKDHTFEYTFTVVSNNDAKEVGCAIFGEGKWEQNGSSVTVTYTETEGLPGGPMKHQLAFSVVEGQGTVDLTSDPKYEKYRSNSLAKIVHTFP